MGTWRGQRIGRLLPRPSVEKNKAHRATGLQTRLMATVMVPQDEEDSLKSPEHMDKDKVETSFRTAVKQKQKEGG